MKVEIMQKAFKDKQYDEVIETGREVLKLGKGDKGEAAMVPLYLHIIMS